MNINCTTTLYYSCNILYQHLEAMSNARQCLCNKYEVLGRGWKQWYHHKANKYSCMLFYRNTLQFGMSWRCSVQSRLHVILWHNTFIHDRQNAVSIFHHFVTDYTEWLACAQLHHTYKATSLKHQDDSAWGIFTLQVYPARLNKSKTLSPWICMNSTGYCTYST